MNSIPGHLLVREIKEYIAADEESVEKIAKNGLFERAGVDQTSYARWEKGAFDASFDVADKLMAAMGKSYMWTSDPDFNEAYMRVNLTGMSWREQERHKRGTVTPEGALLHPPRECGSCGETFQKVNRGGQVPGYCSVRCQRDGENARHRERRRLRAA